jgi:hypothetical protein
MRSIVIPPHASFDHPSDVGVTTDSFRRLPWNLPSVSFDHPGAIAMMGGCETHIDQTCRG